MTNRINNLRTVWAVIIMLALIILTRGHGLDTIIHLPDFTLPALFIAGVYLRHWMVPTLFIVTAIAVDNYAIVYQGISANCITPAYSVLPIAYLFMYLGGRYVDSLNIDSFQQLLKVAFVLIIAASAEWLLATLSYYAFTSASWAGFGAYALKWAPVEMGYVFYWMIAVSIVFTLNHRYSFIPYFSTQKN
jgi:hypothetical protein